MVLRNLPPVRSPRTAPPLEAGRRTDVKRRFNAILDQRRIAARTRANDRTLKLGQRMDAEARAAELKTLQEILDAIPDFEGDDAA